jgi:hypothetical protein
MPCTAEALSGNKRCRIHGGAPGSGAPLGNKNALKQGLCTREAIAEHQRLQALLRQAHRLVQGIEWSKKELKLSASTPLVNYSPAFLVDLVAQPDADARAASILIDEFDAAPIQRLREPFSPFRLVAPNPHPQRSLGAPPLLANWVRSAKAWQKATVASLKETRRNRIKCAKEIVAAPTAVAETVANRCRYRIGTRLINEFKGVERGIRQSRFGSGNSSKPYHTFFIGNRGHCINYFLWRIL